MTTGKITQDTINDAAWRACDTFRGPVSPEQYKDYILVMLFLKYISDTWRAHYAEYRRLYSDDDTRIRRKLERERFVLPIVEYKKENPGTGKLEVMDSFEASFYSLLDRRNAPNIGELINITLDAIEEKNKAKLEGVFRNIDFNSEAALGPTQERNRLLALLLEDFNKPELDLSPDRVTEDIIGNTYMFMISKFAADSGKKAGEFYTPAPVAELVAKLANPKPGQRICDPACGSGGLLLAAGHEVGNSNYALYGMEVNGATWALCRMNMFLHNADSARIERCNTLTAPALVENDQLMKFDIVVANPPFSLDKWGAEEAEADRFNRFWRGIPPKSKGDWAFISHMIEAAEPGSGRVAVVVPHGVLFRGSKEGLIRRAVIEENLLDAVIGLPANLFFSTGIPVAILVFDRSRERGGANESRHDVLFIDASREFEQDKKQNSMTDEQIAHVVETYRNRREVEKYAHVASIEEIRENEFNLNIPRYVDTFEAEEEIDIDAVQTEIDQLETELAEVRKKMAELLKGIKR